MGSKLRVLIVDDLQPKIAKIIALLVDTGLCDRDFVAVAQTGFQARQLLKENVYDLMILDVVLPNRPEEEPKKDGGVQLLTELMSREHFHRPRYIVGLTAYPDAFQNAAGEFADYTWAIIQYEGESTSWHDPIMQLLRHIERLAPAAGDLPSYNYDVCVVTALDEEEDALLRAGWNWKELRIAGDPTSYKEATFTTGRLTGRVVTARCARMGMVSAAVLSANMIQAFRPRMIVSIGICAGMRGKVKVGDIVIADPSWDYQSGKFNGKSFEMAPHQLPLNSAVRRRIRTLGAPATLAEVKRRWSGKAPDTELKLHIGPFASGSAVLADQERLEDLKLQHRAIIAIDMEVYGIYMAAAEAAAPPPVPLAIKSISDYGDEKKQNDSEYREYACFVSAAVFQKFLDEEYADLSSLVGG